MPHRHIASPELRDAGRSGVVRPERAYDRLSPVATAILFAAIVAGYALLIGPHLLRDHDHGVSRLHASADLAGDASSARDFAGTLAAHGDSP